MQTKQRQYTPEEYLAQEEVAEFRSEYRAGEIIPMTGGSLNHNQIAGNVFAFLKFMLRKTQANPYIGDLRLWIPEHCQHTCPDVLVIQGEPMFAARRTDTVLNPCLIVEVLSAFTKNYDRTDKFRYYRSISVLQEYVLIDQYAVGIEQYTRAEDDAWLFRSYDADAEMITFASVAVEMPIQDIYDNVRFTPST